MDPNEVLRLFREAIARRDWRSAAEHADVLDGWMTAGGFLPNAWQGPNAVSLAQQRLAEIVSGRIRTARYVDLGDEVAP